MDAPVFRRHCLRRSGNLCQERSHHLHKECEDADLSLGWPIRRRMSCAAIARILVGAEDTGRENATGHLSRRRPRIPPTRTPARCNRSHDGMVRPLFEIMEDETHARQVPEPALSEVEGAVQAERSSAKMTD